MLNGLRCAAMATLLVLGLLPQQAVFAQQTIVSPPATTTRPPKIPAMNFAKDSGLSRFSLSPNGSFLALRATVGRTAFLAIIDVATRKPLHKIDIPAESSFEWMRWAGSGKLLLSISKQVEFEGDDLLLSRLFLYDLATKRLSLVGKSDMGFDGDDVIFVDPAGEFVLLSMQRSIYDYPSVWRFPLDGTAMKNGKEIERARTGVWDWFADTSGVVRMAFEPVDGGRLLKVFYRTGPGAPMKIIAKIDDEGSTEQWWDVVQIVPGSNIGLVFRQDRTSKGRLVLRKFDFSTRTPGEIVYAAPGADIEGVAFDDKQALVAAYFTDERQRTAWLQPGLQRIQSQLEKALPGMVVQVVSRATDNSRMIVWAGSEYDPGVYFIYDAAKANLDVYFQALEGIDPAHMAQPKPIKYNARDGTVIHGYLTLPPGRDPKKLPLIILPHGGPYGVRDTLDYSSEVQFLANRGYAVLQPNYRGSGGYGDDFDDIGRGQIGRAMQDDLDDGMDWAVKEGIADPDRVCMVGSSYGGYAALWAVTRNPERYRCAASFAGVTDWGRILRYDAQFFSRYGNRKWKERVRGEDGFDLNLVSPLAQVARLARPVLLAHGDKDTRVPFKQFTTYRDAAAKGGKAVETLLFPGEGHGFDLNENEAKWYEALETFLTKHNPAD